MYNQILIHFLQAAGLLHLGLIAAGLAMRNAVNLKEHLACLPPFVRRLFWVYYLFIGICLAGFGTLTTAFAHALASGEALARALCVFMAVFWFGRLIVAVFVFDVRPYLTNVFWRIGYHATNVAFASLPIIYIWAALKGGNQ